MELWRLRYFLVLAEVLHFGRAAEQLHITQPGLSQQVQKLEQEMGVCLFERGRQTRLTAAGEALADAAGPLLGHADQVREQVRQAAAGVHGTLRVLLTRSAPTQILHRALEGFREANPDIDVQTETAWTTHNVGALRRGAADVAAVLLPLQEQSGLDVRELERVELSVILPSEHRLARRRRIGVDELTDEPFVAWPREQAPGAWDRLVRSVWRRRTPRIVRTEPDIERMLTAVQDGHGLTFATRQRARQLRRRGVAVRDLRQPAPDYVFGWCWDAQSTNPALGRFVDGLRTPRNPDPLSR